VIKIKHIVQFSGGAASAYVAKLVIDKFGKENTILLHHDTKAEDPDTYRFLEQISNYLDHEITDVSDGRSLWELIEDTHCIPNYFMPFCTQTLKLKPAEKFYKSLSEPFIQYNGFGPNEWKRVAKAMPRAEIAGRQLKCLLYERNINDEQVKDTIRHTWKICLPNAYRFLNHNNCIPCWKGGKGHFYQIWLHYPKQFKQAIEAEKSTEYIRFKDETLEELAKKWKAGNMDNLFDDDAGIPCMCAD